MTVKPTPEELARASEYLMGRAQEEVALGDPLDIAKGLALAAKATAAEAVHLRFTARNATTKETR